MTRRLIAGFLTLCMIVSLCPPSAFAVHSSASEMTEPETVVTEPAVTEPDSTPEETGTPETEPPESTAETAAAETTLPAESQPADEAFSYRSVPVGHSIVLTAGLAEGGSWSSDNLAAATVTSAEGDTLNATVYGVAEGTTTVTYTAEGAVETWIVYVTADKPTAENAEEPTEAVVDEPAEETEATEPAEATMEEPKQDESLIEKIGDLLTGNTDTQAQPGASTQSITASKTTIYVGETITLNGTSNGYASCTYGSWSVSGTAASVNGNGDTATLTGDAVGTVTITHTYCDKTTQHYNYYGTYGHSSKTETITITVEAPALTGIELTSGARTYVKGTTQLTAAAVPAGAALGTLTWTSGNTDILTVDQNGLVTGVSAGTANVTVTDGTFTATTAVTITAVSETEDNGSWVYVYTQVTGNTDGLTLNASGWYTLGRVFVPGLASPSNYSVGSSGTTTMKDSAIAAVRSGLLHEHNTGIDVGAVTFNALLVANGANDYVNAGSNTWHLDGTLARSYLATVVYRYRDAAGNTLRADSAGEVHTVNTTINKSASDAPAITGYTCTSVEGSPVTLSESKTYYITYIYSKNAYTVTYTDGANGEAFADQKYTDLAHGVATPAFSGTPTRTGYTFKGWSPKVSDTVTQNETYTAQWEKKTVGYTVEYYYDGNLNSSKTETGTAEFGDVISDYTDKPETGYRFDRTENRPLTIGEDASANVIKVYYVKDDTQQHSVSYRVNYYRDGALVESGTPKTETDWIGSAISVTVDKNKINTADKFVGYKFVKTEPADIPDSYDVAANGESENHVINVYYVKDKDQTHTVSYRVEYYKDGQIAETDSSVSATGWISEATTVTVNVDAINTTNKYVGYKFDKTEPESIPSGYTVDAEKASPDEYVIKVYYVKDGSQIKEVRYTVVHKVEGEVRKSDTYTESVWVNDPDEITVREGTLAKQNYTGYKFDSMTPETTEGSKVASDSVITLTYVKDDSQTQDTKYTVRYTINGNEKESFDVTGTAWINDSPAMIAIAEGGIPAPADKYQGYQLDPKNPTYPAAGALVESGSVYTVNYVARNDTAYTVEHYQQNLVGDAYTLANTDNMSGTTGDLTAAVARSYPGFTAQSFEQETIAPDGSTVVKIYYNRNTYTVTYTDGVTDETVFKDRVTENVRYGTATPAFGEIPTRTGYVFAGWNPAVAETVTADATYAAKWTPATGTAYTVKHYQQNLEDDGYTLTDTDNPTGTTGELTKAAAKDYSGFTVQKFEQVPIAPDGSTVVEIYYTRNSYNVTYEYTGTVPAGATALPAKASYKYGADVTVADKASADGYVFHGWNKDGTEITGTFRMPAGNVTITGSFTERTDLSYTVNYLEKDTGSVLHTQKVQGNVTFGNVVKASDEVITIEGYKYDSADKETLTITTGENVINLYYTRRTDLYAIVNYYWNGTGEKAAPSKELYNQTLGEAWTESPIEIQGYTIATTSSKTITIQATGNVINFYYYKNVELTANGDEVTYDGNEHSVTGYIGAPAGADFSGIIVTPSASGTNADTYDAKFADGTEGKVDATHKYIVTKATDGKLIINPAAVTVTADNKTKVFGADDPKLTATVTGTLNGDQVTYTLSREPGEDVGSYTITPTGEKIQGNYEVTYETGTLTITKNGTLTVSGTDYTGTYDANEHGEAATASVTEGTIIEYQVNGGEWTTEVPKIKDVGTVTVKVRATNPNYETTEATYTLTVTPAPVTVTADNKSKVYGEADPELTATVTGTLNGDKVTYTVSRVPGENVGGYTVTPAGAEIQGNYKVTYETGTLTITASGTLTVSGTDYTGTYDANAHGEAATASVTEGTIIEYQVNGGEWTTEVPKITNVGTVTVKVRATNPNYETAEATYTLTVTPAAVTVTADNKTKVFGADDPAFTATVSGVLDDAEIIYTLSRESGEDVGDYTITPTGEKIQGNYEVTYETGTLTITKNGTLTVSGTDYTGTYDANEHGEAATASVTEGTTIEYQVNGGEWTTEVPKITNVGTMTVKVKATNPNYETAEDTYTLTVDYATVTVAADNKTKVFGADDPAFTATVSGVLDDAKISYTLSRVPGEDVGDYTITPTGEEIQGNYKVTYETGTLTITPVTEKIVVTVTGHTGTAVYDGTAHTVTGYDVAVSNPLYTAADFAFTGTASVTGTDADGYPMGLAESQFRNVSANFTEVSFIVNDGGLTVDKRPVTLTSVTDSKVYDRTPLTRPDVTVGGMGFVTGEVTGLHATGSVLNVSEGAVRNDIVFTPTAAFKAGNYTIEYHVGTLSITPAAQATVVVTGNTETVVYDGQPHTVTGFTNDGRSRDITVTLLRAGADSATGTDIDRYYMGLTAADFIASSPNYRKVNVEVVDGYLDIVTVNVNVTITVRGNRDTVTYDGNEHTVTGYEIVSVTTNVGRTVTMDGLTLKLRGTASATGTEPGTYPMGLTAADFDADTTIYRGVRVVVEDGELVIEPAAVPETEPTTETIPDESVPMGQPEDIPDEDVPMAAPAWALLNLILSLLTVLGSLFLLSGLFGKKKEEATDENGNLILDDNGESVMNRIKQRAGWRITSLLPAIGSVIAFILTENMRNPMVLVDRWTLLMVIIAVIQILVMMLSKKKVEETEEA